MKRRTESAARPRPNASKLSSKHLRRNAILAELGESVLSRVAEAGTLVDLKVRHVIYHAESVINEVYFPLDCVLSVVTQMADGDQIEIGTIGREGTTALPLLLGAETTANECYCQVPGTALCISAAIFQSLRQDPTFRRSLDRYVQAYVNMLGQLAACNRLHHVYERCARWLLMTHDRVGSAEFNLTHEYLAMMLGTQRSGVTIAAAMLQSAGFIRYGKGVIKILDRSGLEGATCECYVVARHQFSGLFRSVAKGDSSDGALKP